MQTVLFHEIIFGPIHSRRLGISLGVNLLPVDGKLCSFDCVYCECGYNAQGVGKSGLPSSDRVEEELKSRLQSMHEAGEKLDVITFAGNGEPTLHPEFEKIIDTTLYLRDHYYPEAKISVLSNATRIHDESVFRALNRVDNNILKLDSLRPETVVLIDNPNDPHFDVNKVVDNLKRFSGNVIIQTMFLRGWHDGTPAACRQKNAAEYLAGRSPGVMTQYGGGLFGAEQHLHSREPAPDEDKSGVLQLVEWREEAPYG